jgi:hypothetical protein
MNFFLGLTPLAMIFVLGCIPTKSQESTISEHNSPINVKETVVTGAKNVEALFPSTSEIQLINVKISAVDMSVPQAQRRVINHFISLSAQQDEYLSWFHQRSDTLKSPIIVTVIKQDRAGFSTTVTGYRKALDNAFLDQIVLANWMVEGVQYNPPAAQNPKREIFILDPLGKKVNIALDFGADGRLELNSDQLRLEYSEERKRSFFVDFASTLVPRLPADPAR